MVQLIIKKRNFLKKQEYDVIEKDKKRLRSLTFLVIITVKGTINN